MLALSRALSCLTAPAPGRPPDVRGREIGVNCREDFRTRMVLSRSFAVAPASSQSWRLALKASFKNGDPASTMAMLQQCPSVASSGSDVMVRWYRNGTDSSGGLGHRGCIRILNVFVCVCAWEQVRNEDDGSHGRDKRTIRKRFSGHAELGNTAIMPG